MIKSFRSKALERFWTRHETRRVHPDHVKRLRLILSLLDVASELEGANFKRFDLHRLTGDQAGRYALKVDKNWRVTFAWDQSGPDALDLDYEDYH